MSKYENHFLFLQVYIEMSKNTSSNTSIVRDLKVVLAWFVIALFFVKNFSRSKLQSLQAEISLWWPGNNRTSIPKHNIVFFYRSLQPSFFILVNFVFEFGIKNNKKKQQQQIHLLLLLPASNTNYFLATSYKYS